MDVYLLGPNFNVVHIIENFESFIWTERNLNAGDFELVVPIGGRNYTTFAPGRYIHIKESRTLMIIEKTVMATEDDGRQLIRITGQSFESHLKQRVITTNGVFTNHTASVIASRLVRDICVNGAGLSNSDIIPGLEIDSVTPSDTLIEYVDYRKKNLYTVVRDLCEMDNLRFDIKYIPEDGNRLLFGVNTGTDRTIDRTDRPGYSVVIFSEAVGNLVGFRHLRSIEDYKNVAYVWHEDRTNPLIVYALGATSPWVERSPSEPVIHTGTYRKVLSVDAGNIENPSNQELELIGREALREHNYKDYVDGEASPMGNFRYNVNYYMNDLVKVSRIVGGPTVKARVVEHIWSVDSSGTRAYPTLEYVESM